jgi:acetylornithine deacetylase
MKPLDSVEILERLVACPTVSRDSNLPLIDWVRNYLADYGVHSQLVPDATGGKSNLLATVGPLEEGGLVLSGHTDVVPVDGQSWSSDPFSLSKRDSRLYGRGTCDMKGFIAATLSKVPTWRTLKLVRPVHLMFSYDEEVGCLGAPFMIAAAQKVLPKPGAVIVGEPTGMQVASEHKGICTVRTRVRGIEAHSSLTHQGVSAVMLAGEMIANLIEISRELSARATPLRRFEPPHTTLSVNRIQGGTAINILAAACEFDWDVRSLPGETGTSIVERAVQFAAQRVAELSAQGKQCAIETSVQADVPPLKADNGAAEELARAAAGFSADALTVPFATEAGQFQSVGWSTVVCGPGNIEQAHKTNEFIECSELAACEAFLDRAVARQCRNQS